MTRPLIPRQIALSGLDSDLEIQGHLRPQRIGAAERQVDLSEVVGRIRAKRTKNVLEQRLEDIEKTVGDLLRAFG